MSPPGTSSWRSAARCGPSPRRTGTPRPRDLLLDGFALLITEGHAAADADVAASGASGRRTFPWRTSCGGAGWPRAPARPCGTTKAGSRSLHTAGPGRPRRRRAGGAADPPHVPGDWRIAWTGDFVGRRTSLVAEIDSVAAATGTRLPALRPAATPRAAGREDEASAVDASAIEQFGGPGHRRPCGRVLGGRGPVQRPRPLRGGGSGGPASRHERTPQPLDLHVGAARAGRGGRAHRRHRARPRRAGAAGERRRNPAAPSSRSASRRAAGRC